MNKHLQLVRELNDARSLPQANYGREIRVPDMDIIMRQALLFAEGSAVLKAFKLGDMVEILTGLVNLAYCALEAIALAGGDVKDSPITWRHDGFIISIMRSLSDKIHHCSSGSIDEYSAVYGLCVHLTGSFINADFDKAFQMIHHSKISNQLKIPDLSPCLFE